LDIILTFKLVAAIVIAFFIAYNIFHYVLFLLVTRPKDASKIGHALNQFEERQLIEWTPQPSDFLKHDDEKSTYDDVFGAYRDEQANYSTCVFPRVAFSRPYEAEYALLKLKEGMRCYSDFGRHLNPYKSPLTLSTAHDLRVLTPDTLFALATRTSPEDQTIVSEPRWRSSRWLSMQ
jgi:hypothetical protein